MNILSLNTWGGRAGKAQLLDFFRVHGPTTDVFCLQEIWSASYSEEVWKASGMKGNQADIQVHGLKEISEVLPDHRAYFRPHHMENYGLAMFVKKDLVVHDEGELFVHQYKGYIPDGDIGHHARNIQYVTLQTMRGLVTVINFHGLWNGQGKTDSPDRLEQSRKIIEFMQKRSGELVLCGDFNLSPDTESIRMFERAGFRNLIREYGVTSTRTSLYTKPETFADYVFVSPDIQVTSFGVLPDVVSDHAPIRVTIE